MKKYCIYGTGGFGREVFCLLIDTIANQRIAIPDYVCFMIDDEYYTVGEIMGVQVIRRSEFEVEKYQVLIAVGDPAVRKMLAESMPTGTIFGKAIHPTAVISSWVKIGEGSIITAGCILTCNINIGKHAHLNLLTTVGHDCNIGDYFTAAPAVNISGNCTFGDEVYFGTNSCVREKISICNKVTIGMGAVVVKNITQSGVYVGSPAKRFETKLNA